MSNEISIHTDTLTCKVPGYTIPWLHDYAARRLMTLSELVRHAIAYYIDQMPQNAASDAALSACLEDVPFRRCTSRRYAPPVAAQVAEGDAAAKAEAAADLADFERRVAEILADYDPGNGSGAPLDTMETSVSNGD